jgi:RNA polymerase sigma factor (sigma-70 family)
MKTVIRHLRRAALLNAGDGLTDSQLLEYFVLRRDETAFEALLRRHGSMVLGVCRRILRNAHDAEDAFQATFLVLVRKASSLRSRELLGNWLYGVAYRTAMKARTMNAKQRAKERQASALPHSEVSTGGADEDLLEQLDRELSRLPDKYRVPVVLCELEGRSRKEVARLVGVPEGTLSWRLAQAKKLLAKKLSRHGVTLTSGPLAAATVSAGLSPTLSASAVKTVFSSGSVPAKVMALTEGVMKAMLLSKLKMTMCAAALMLLAGVGAGGLTYRATADEPTWTLYAERVDGRPQADDLEALRLEIEALRKELRATKARVKALEDAGAQSRRNEPNSRAVEGQLWLERLPDQRKDSQWFRRDPVRTEQSRASVEETMKKLLANPKDKEANEAFERAVQQEVTKTLEQALKQLQEQEKPKPTPENVPRK